MVEGAENACCAAWKKKHSKLLEKYSKLEELKNKFRDCTSLVNQQYDVIEKQHGSLKQELGNLKVQADRWKDEKEQEYSRRVDLESEVSALKREIKLLQQNGNAASNDSERHLQECLDVAEIKINQLKELLEKERCRADLEKKNADMERNKTKEALKKLEAGKNKVSEAQKAVGNETKKAEANNVLYERLKLEIDAVKSKLSLEQSKSEAANKKVEDEKQNTIKERKRADVAVAKAEELRKLSETNLKKAIVENERADDLDKKLNEEKRRTEKLEEKLLEYLCSRKLAEAHIDLSIAGIESELTSDVGVGMVKGKAVMSQGIEKMVKEQYKNNIREKKRKKVAEAHKREAIEEKYCADQLSQELEGCKQRLEELQKRQQISGRMLVDNPPVRQTSNNSDRATVKLLKKQKKLEKILVKHAKKVTKVDVRNDMLHQELFHIKKRFRNFENRLNILEDCFVHGRDVIHELEKWDTRKILGAVGSMEKLYSKGQKLHEQVSKKLSVLHDILRDHNNDPAEQNLPEISCREQGRPTKRRKTSHEGTKIINYLHNSNERKDMLDPDIEKSNVNMEASSPGLDVGKSDQC